MKESHKEILTENIRLHGARMRSAMAVEEMAELTKELMKNIRGDDNRAHIVEEMADVYIVLNGLRILFDITGAEIDDVMDYKMARLDARNKKIIADKNAD